MATPAKRNSYVDIFGDKLPSRFPVPQAAKTTASLGVDAARSYTESRPSGSLRVPLRKRVRSFFTNVWDSRIAMKLFGSRKELEMEEERLQNIEYFLIHPCSKFRILWDVVMLLILSINTVLLPVAISFFRELINPGWLSFTCFSDIFFITDIVLNFWTGVITDENLVILDLRMIRRIYVKRWLLFDILSVFPFDYVAIVVIEANSLNTSYLQATTALRLLRLLKLLSLLRLFRVVKLMHYLAKWEELFNANSPVARITNFILGVLLLAHWNGCIQFLVPFMEGFPSDSWVSINHLQEASVGEQYSWAVFKAISHMLCIGFGRFPPQNITEVWVTIISMLIGATLYAMFIGHISTLIHTADSASRKYKEKLEQVEEYARYRKLPLALKQKVYEYYYQRYHGHMFNEQDILNELSHPLMVEILNYTCQDLIRVVPFFATASEAFITSIITRVSFDVFLPGDYVTQYGAIGTKMYFIQHGVLDVVNRDGKVATSLCDGSYFGEICLLFKCRRVASVKAVTVCDLYSLDRSDFDMILKKFPKMRQTMREVAEERLAQLRDTYGPGWMDSENNGEAVVSRLGSALLGQRPSRTREYLRRVEASRSTAYLQPRHHRGAMGGSSSSSGTSQSRSTQSGVGGAAGRRSLQEMSSLRFHEPSSDSVQIDLPTFSETENIV